jgi:hypothetical protein
LSTDARPAAARLLVAPVVEKQVDDTRIADATAWISRRTLDAARDVVRYHAERTTTASSCSQTLMIDHQEKKLT